MDPSIPQVPKEPVIGLVCMAQVGNLVMRAVYCVHVGGHLTDVVMPDRGWTAFSKVIEPELDLATEPTNIKIQHRLLPDNATLVGVHRSTGVRFWIEISSRIVAPMVGQGAPAAN